MYRVILQHLSPDARTVVPRGRLVREQVTAAELLELMRGYCTIDAIENATAESEIRVQAGPVSYVLTSFGGKLVLHDMQQRSLPGQRLDVDAALAEIDGTAAAARARIVQEAQEQAALLAAAEELPSGRGQLLLPAIAAVVFAAAIPLVRPPTDPGRPDRFQEVSHQEHATLVQRYTGVYMTGTEPGQHGIVLAGTGELKLFEVGAIEAPRTILAEFDFGRIGPRLFLATDQPGGLIEATNDQAFLYCGEKYRRIP